MKSLSVSLLLIMIGSTELVWAHEGRGSGREHGPPGIHLLREADGNADAKLTQAEVRKAVHSAFRTADLDGNGLLAQEELTAFLETKRRTKILGRFAAFDKNSDGKVNRAELGDREAHLLDRIDENGDGEATRAELEAHLEKSQERAEGRVARWIHRMDKNQDSMLSKSEMEAAALELFSRLDASGNGVLEEAEFDRAGKHHGDGHSDEAERRGRSRQGRR